jgi:hypothetical protein
MLVMMMMMMMMMLVLLEKIYGDAGDGNVRRMYPASFA